MHNLKEKIHLLQTNFNLTPEKFFLIDDTVKAVEKAIYNHEISRQEAEHIARDFNEDFLNNTMHGHVLRKPFGPDLAF